MDIVHNYLIAYFVFIPILHGSGQVTKKLNIGKALLTKQRPGISVATAQVNLKSTLEWQSNWLDILHIFSFLIVIVYQWNYMFRIISKPCIFTLLKFFKAIFHWVNPCHHPPPPPATAPTHTVHWYLPCPVWPHTSPYIVTTDSVVRNTELSSQTRIQLY